MIFGQAKQLLIEEKRPCNKVYGDSHNDPADDHEVSDCGNEPREVLLKEEDLTGIQTFKKRCGKCIRRFTKFVNGRRLMTKINSKARLPGAQANVRVFVIHEESRIETIQLLEGFSSDGHAGTGNHFHFP